MKAKILIFLFTASLFSTSCGKSETKKNNISSQNCEADLKKTQDSLKLAQKDQEKLEDIMSLHDLLFPVPDDINEQESIDIKDYSDSNVLNQRYGALGKIDVDKDYIEVHIPVTEKKLKIVNYINISTKETNALLIVLDGNNGKYTPDNGIKKIIKKKYKISKTGLDKDLLRKHGKLKICVIHDDNFNSGHVIRHQRCIRNYPGYNEDDCLYDFKFPNNARPDEIGGDIIP